MSKLLGSLGTLLIFLSPQIVQAQNLEGQISHKYQEKALKGVKITVIGQDRTYHTDKDGRFRIEELEIGSNWIEISHPGFKTQKRELFFKKDFEEESWDIHLCPGRTLSLSGESSLGNKSRQDKLHSPFFSEEIGQTEFREYARRNLSQNLMTLPGLWIQDFGPAKSSPVLRALSGDHNALFLDGFRLNNGFTGSQTPSLINSIDPIMLDQASVLLGSSSAAYGSDALGGAILLESQSPDFADEKIEVHGNLLMRYMGKDTEQSGAGSLQFNSSRLGILANFGKRNLGGLVPGSAGKNFRQESTLVKAKLKISPRHLLSMSYIKNRQEQVRSRESGKTVEELKDKLRPLQWQMTYAKWVSRFDNKWFKEMRISGAYQQYDESREQEFSQESLFRKEENQSKSWTGIFEVHSQPSIYWDIVSGVEVYQEGIRSAAYQGRSGFGNLNLARPRYLDGAEGKSMDIYSLHTFQLVKLRLSLGGRAHRSILNAEEPDFGNISNRPQAFSGNISAVYPLTQHIFLSSSFNTGFRPPNVQDFSGLGTQDNRFEVLNDSLGAERSFTSQIGLKAKTSGFSGSLVLYRTRLNDFIDYASTDYLGNNIYEGREVVQKVNGTEAYIQGIEASVEVPLSSAMAFYGSLLYTSGEKLVDQTSLSRIPPLNGRLGLRFRSKVGVWTRLEWQKAAAQNNLSPQDLQNPYIGPEGTASWNVLNLHVGYDFNWGYMTLGIQNFFDQKYRLHGSHVDAMEQVILLSMQLGF